MREDQSTEFKNSRNLHRMPKTIKHHTNRLAWIPMLGEVSICMSHVLPIEYFGFDGKVLLAASYVPGPGV
jgi:hypothetical protein